MLRLLIDKECSLQPVIHHKMLLCPFNNFCFVLLILLFVPTTTCSAKQITSYSVSNALTLKNAIKEINLLPDDLSAKVILSHGIYTISNIVITHPNTQITSATGKPKDVIVQGNGMHPSKQVEVIFDIRASNVSIVGLTLQNVSNHLIQIRAEMGVNNFLLENSILQNSYQQLLKVSASDNNKYAKNGIVRNNIFRYTAETGPNFYIGGIDAHHARNWLVENNVFENIASPHTSPAEHAIHFWNDSQQIKVVHNTIINSDRGIGFGLGEKSPQNEGGEITDNFVIQSNGKHKYSDVAIGIESSSNIVIDNNLLISNHKYPNSIEYRFRSTSNIKIVNNKTNRVIASRDGATAQVENNTSVGHFESFCLKLEYLIHYYFFKD